MTRLLKGLKNKGDSQTEEKKKSAKLSLTEVFETIEKAADDANDAITEVRSNKTEFDSFKDEVRRNTARTNELSVGLKKDLDDVLEGVEERLDEIEKSVDESFTLNQGQYDFLMEEIGKVRGYFSEVIKGISSRTDSSDGRISEIQGLISSEIKGVRSYIASEILNLDNKKNEGEMKNIWGSIREFEKKLEKLYRDAQWSGGSTQLVGLQNAVQKAAGYGINFKSGTNTTVSVSQNNSLGVIDVAINATGGVGAWTPLAVDKTTTTFSVASQPTDVLADGELLLAGFGYTYNAGAGTITFTNAPQSFAAWR